MKDFKNNRIRNQKTVLLKNMRKKAVRRERRRDSMRRVVRRAAMILLAVLSLGGTGWGVYALLTSPVFLVKRITLEGNTHLQEESLRSYEGQLTSNIFRLNLGEIRRDLLQEPYVKHAFLRRELPDRIYIRIEERVPYAMLRMKKQRVLVDREGRLLEEIDGDSRLSLPAITGIDQDRKAGWKEDLSQALSLLETITNYGYPDLADIREIEMVPGQGAVLHPAGKAFEIRFGTDDFLHKMILLKRVAGDLVKRQWRIEEIDMRFSEQVVVRTERPLRML